MSRLGKHSSLRRLGLAILLLGSAPLKAAELTLAVHPVLPTKQTVAIYQPLADYLSQATGHTIRLETTNNFLVHWQKMKRGNFDLILDGPHFTGYRVQKMGYTALAKLPEVVSYTLVAHEDLFVLEPRDLIGKTIATLPSPGLGALRLADLYPNPMRQPRIVEADNSVAAAEKVLDGQAAAAIIPAPLVGRFPTLVTVTTTEQVPAPAISASSKVEPSVQQAIKKALLEAANHPVGQKALEAVNTTAFEPGDNATYAPYAELLQEVWGY